MSFRYTTEPQLAVEEFIDLLRRSTLSERRPVDDVGRMREMINFASILLCARDGTKLVGISRALTDFSYCCYLSDLAVAVDYQRQGIGKELIRLTHEIAGDNTVLILLAAPAARDYYQHIGFEKVDNAWKIRRKK